MELLVLSIQVVLVLLQTAQPSSHAGKHHLLTQVIEVSDSDQGQETVVWPPAEGGALLYGLR